MNDFNVQNKMLQPYRKDMEKYLAIGPELPRRYSAWWEELHLWAELSHLSFISEMYWELDGWIFLHSSSRTWKIN